MLLSRSETDQLARSRTLPENVAVSVNVCHQPERLSQSTSSPGFIATYR